jgi:hypothetical protein
MLPNTQINAYGQPMAPEREDQLFKEKFTSIAYTALASRFSDLMQYIITFKILDFDLNKGFAVGVFILDYESNPIYIPVILNDGMLKPIELMYCKNYNAFLPLNTAWLDEVTKAEIANLGSPQDIPQGATRNISVRNLVIPPNTMSGREGYASDMSCVRMLKEAEVQEFKPSANQFLEILAIAPSYVLEGIKVAFTKHPVFLEKCAAIYGIDKLTNAFKRGYKRANLIKKAAVSEKGTIQILTQDSPTELIRNVFGKHAGSAYSTMLKHGFAVSDTRDTTKNRVIKTETPKFLTSPGPNAGWYRLYFLDAPADIYYVMPESSELADSYVRFNSESGYTRQIPRHVIISADGVTRWTETDIVGERIFNLPKKIRTSKIYKALHEGIGDTPKVNSYGYFLAHNNGRTTVTSSDKITQIVTENGQKKYALYGETIKVATDPKIYKIIKIMDTILIPKHAVFIEQITGTANQDNYDIRKTLRVNKPTTLIKDPKMLLNWTNAELIKAGSVQLDIKYAGENQWYLGSNTVPVPWITAVTKIATDCSVPVADAVFILSNAKNRDTQNVHLIRDIFNKTAQDMPMEEPMIGGGELAPPSPPLPMRNEGMPALEEMPAPTINPTDLALGEAVQDLQHQMQLQMQESQSQVAQIQQQMDMQQQSMQQLIQTLQGIQERSMQLAQGSQGMIPSNAMNSPSVAAKGIAPVIEEEPPPPPMPVMDQDTINPEMIAQQIHPEVAEQAAELNDAGLFDTAAITALSNVPALQDIIESYVPTMEKAVDNLGRVLLTLALKEDMTKQQLGEERFIQLEDKVRTTFNGLGDLVINLNRDAAASSSTADDAEMQRQSAVR